MIVTEKYLQAYAEKLIKTGSFNAAFTKAVWMAFKDGLEAERTPLPRDTMPPKWSKTE
jgi:hypothetical protein